MSDKKITAGITLGDINGVGCEVVIKALLDSRMTEMFTPVIYGPAKALSHYKKIVEGGESFSYNIINSPKDARGKTINVVNCELGEIRIEPGVSTHQAGQLAVDSLKKAVEDLKRGHLDVLITAPINKENVQSAEFPFTGHTDYLASEFRSAPLMVMCSELMRVGLVTVHMPLSQVSACISREAICDSLGLLRDSMIRDFGYVEPRIAVLSLNPHAGDGGLLGQEEQQVIKPAIAEAYQNGILAFGPFAPDGFFASAGYSKYDAVLAMYHDQGLAPFKALTPQGVNFSAGLPIVRTSPDHGVAYDIAGTGKADEQSMREAIYAALDIYRRRRAYELASRNPLKHYERERGADMSVRDLLPENENEAD